jgi:hypothetical protein
MYETWIKRYLINKIRNSVGKTTRLRTGRTKFPGSIPGRGKRFVSSSSSPSYKKYTGQCFPGAKRQGLKLTIHFHLVPRLTMVLYLYSYLCLHGVVACGINLHTHTHTHTRARASTQAYTYMSRGRAVGIVTGSGLHDLGVGVRVPVE